MNEWLCTLFGRRRSLGNLLLRKAALLRTHKRRGLYLFLSLITPHKRFIASISPVFTSAWPWCSSACHGPGKLKTKVNWNRRTTLPCFLPTSVWNDLRCFLSWQYTQLHSLHSSGFFFQVIRFIEDGILLQKPYNCPSTIYHVMLGCWRSNPRDRYVFQ